MQDPYKILDLDQSATEKEVKSAYRKLAAKFHPDNKETGNEEKFKEITQAYQDIINPKPQEQNTFSGFGGGINFSDFFQHINQSESFSQPEPIEISIELTFKEAVLGCEKDISFERNILCEKCEGSGKKFSKEKCKKCNGQGKIKELIKQQNFTFQQIIDCKECQGYGKKIESDCQECNGKKTKLNVTSGKIKIPNGILPGQPIRLRGAGNQIAFNNRFLAGDIFIKVTVIPYENLVYNQDTEAVHSNITISLLEALSGTTKEIYTIDGKQNIIIPKETKNKDILRYVTDTDEISVQQFIDVYVDYPQTNEDIEQLSNYLTSQKKEKTNGNDSIL